MHLKPLSLVTHFLYALILSSDNLPGWSKDSSFSKWLTWQAFPKIYGRTRHTHIFNSWLSPFWLRPTLGYSFAIKPQAAVWGCIGRKKKKLLRLYQDDKWSELFIWQPQGKREVTTERENRREARNVSRCLCQYFWAAAALEALCRLLPLSPSSSTAGSGCFQALKASFVLLSSRVSKFYALGMHVFLNIAVKTPQNPVRSFAACRLPCCCFFCGMWSSCSVLSCLV